MMCIYCNLDVEDIKYKEHLDSDEHGKQVLKALNEMVKKIHGDDFGIAEVDHRDPKYKNDAASADGYIGRKTYSELDLIAYNLSLSGGVMSPR